MKRSFSIIVPTYGRKVELLALLDSICQQEYDRALIEVIIVDQNDQIRLEPELSAYKKELQLKHIITPVKGIAAAKNNGLRHAVNDIVTFADDDSTYYPDTLLIAGKRFEEEPDVDIFYGKLYDRAAQKDILRKWSLTRIKLNKWNYHLNYNAISCFTPVKDLFFDERFGVGTQYGMGEELDYLLRAMKKYNVWFTPEIEIWHPELHVRSMNDQKVLSYAKGYGAICKKHLDLVMFYNFFISSAFQLGSILAMSLKGRFGLARKRYLALKGRIWGFIEFKP